MGNTSITKGSRPAENKATEMYNVALIQIAIIILVLILYLGCGLPV